MGRDAVFIAIRKFEATVRHETDSPLAKLKRRLRR
jgi:hypothetical protein